ncbi:MAG: rhomboid family intramembrane serine protease [Gemmatimonadota bacterium]
MIPISDDNPTFRTPWMTLLILGITVAVWFMSQGAGIDSDALAASICNYGMVPGELTRQAPLGLAIPMGGPWVCVVDDLPVNVVTPITSMFLHGSWPHLLGNCLYLWVFGNNVEDSMGRGRFLVFYLLCGLVAAAAHVAVQPASPVPTVGASGAISGTLGAYLVLHPRAHVKTIIPILIFPWIVSVRAWVILIFWFVWQVLSGLPELMAVRPEVSGGVAVWAHIGGFVAGLALIRVFRNPSLQPPPPPSLLQRSVGRF